MARSTLEDFIVKEKIGTGSYGAVYRATRKVDRCGGKLHRNCRLASQMRIERVYGFRSRFTRRDAHRAVQLLQEHIRPERSGPSGHEQKGNSSVSHPQRETLATITYTCFNISLLYLCCAAAEKVLARPVEGSARSCLLSVRCCLQEQEECIKETQILSSLDSEYIIKYFDSFLDKVTTTTASDAAIRTSSSRCHQQHCTSAATAPAVCHTCSNDLAISCSCSTSERHPVCNSRSSC